MVVFTAAGQFFWTLLVATLLEFDAYGCTAAAFYLTSITGKRRISQCKPFSGSQARRPSFFLKERGTKRSSPVFVVLSEDPKPTDDHEEESILVLERQKGLLVLFSVPLAWGTFEPAVRFVYSVEPPVPGFVFSLSYYLVAAISLSIAALVATNLEQQKQSRDDKDKAIGKPQQQAWPFWGGCELGFYLFVGNALQVFGLKTVPSDRAAFLLQLTTLFVPLAEAGISRNLLAVSGRTWMACAVALIGVAIMGMDNGSSNDLAAFLNSSSIRLYSWSDLTSSINLSTGDCYVIAAAVAYTFHCIRLEGYAKSTSAVRLASAKAWTETLLSALAIGALVTCSQAGDIPFLAPNTVEKTTTSELLAFAQETGKEIAAYGQFVSQGSLWSLPDWKPAIAAVLWTGWVSCAYTIYAQSYGQSRIRPVTANLIYTIQPVCTAIVAWLVLGESLGPLGYLGGFLILSSVYLVATKTSKPS